MLRCKLGSDLVFCIVSSLKVFIIIFNGSSNQVCNEAGGYQK